MSKEIDWAKAPEGYPVWIQDLTGQKPDGSGWHREEIVADDDGSCERWTDVDGKFWPKDCEARGKIIVHRKPVEAWPATGLPPVGTVCEMMRVDMMLEWRKVEILCHGSKRIFFRETADGYEQSRLYSSVDFRPIRTQAQIEAEEREKSIQQMIEDADYDGKMVRGLFAKLHDAGYRKTEAGK